MQAVQAASILCGLPFNLMLCFTCHATWLFCKQVVRQEDMSGKEDEEETAEKEFLTPVYGGVFNVVEYMFSLGKVDAFFVDRHMDLPSQVHLTEFVKGIFIPFWSLYQVLQSTFPDSPCSNIVCSLGYGLMYMAWIAATAAGLQHLDVCLLILTGLTLSYLRRRFRAHHNIRSHWVSDVASSVLFWPQVLMQMREFVASEAPTEKESVTDEDV